MMGINIAVCDDEQTDRLAAKRLVEEYMRATGTDFRLFMFSGPRELLSAQESFDVIFLDIAMGEMDGIEAGERLYRKENAEIIYMTYYPDYCIQAMNQVHAFSYLMKPLDGGMVARQLGEAMDRRKNRRDRMYFSLEILTVTGGGQVVKEFREFASREIYYFEYVNRKIRIKLEKEEYFCVGKLRDMEEKLGGYGFFRCHRAFLVNMEHVSRISEYEVFLDNGESVPVSQKRSPAFRQAVNAHFQKII